MIKKTYRFKCVACGDTDSFSGNKRQAIKQARNIGWKTNDAENMVMCNFCKDLNTLF